MHDSPVLGASGSALELWRQAQGLNPSAQETWAQALADRIQAMDHPVELVTLASELATWGPADHHRGIQLLALLMLIDLRDGSTLTLINKQLVERIKKLGPEGPQGTQAIDTALRLLRNPQLGEPALSSRLDQPAPILVYRETLQFERMARLETQLSHRLRELVNASLHSTNTPTKLEQTTPHLSDEQRLAIETAARRKLTIITGGPGTGKTSIVLALLQVLKSQGFEFADVALSAPTGKATRRLAESTRQLGPDSQTLRTQTLHRLLGAHPGYGPFLYNENHPLPARVVVVDEASMLDLELATRLISALEPETRLILLGDAEQLPSVDPGNVLKDLATTLPGEAVCRLHRSYRMDPSNPAGRRVLQAATAMKDGKVDDFFTLAAQPPLETGASPVRFKSLKRTTERLDFLRDLLKTSPIGHTNYRRKADLIYHMHDGRLVPEDEHQVLELLKQSQSSKLLTITRRLSFQTGSDAVNQRLHALYAQQLKWPLEDKFLPGEPIMMTRNDHERQIYNGDVGLVLKLRVNNGAEHPMAVFPNLHGVLAFDLDALADDLVLAHAMTVHKAQGSEYERIALLLPETCVPLLTREILYTAVTRARQEILIAGEPEVLAAGLRQRVVRTSGLAAALRGDP